MGSMDGKCGIGSVGEECGGSVGDGVWEGSGGMGCVRRWSVGWGVWDGKCGMESVVGVQGSRP